MAYMTLYINYSVSKSDVQRAEDTRLPVAVNFDSLVICHRHNWTYERETGGACTDSAGVEVI